ncbi:MAG TPA: AI-2E family transporter [Desulfobulbus sp.]|nr:AI-2E family transporter [Desulfobulbus sp.]
MAVRREAVNKVTLLILVVTISALFLTMIRQFLMPIFMAGLFTALVKPMHRWITGRLGGRENLASILTIIGIICLVLVPLGLLTGVVVNQAIHVGQSVTPWVQGFISEPSSMSVYLEKIPFYDQILPYRDVIIRKAGELVGNLSSFLIDSLSSVTRLTVNAVISSVIMLYVMFYFLTMGRVLLVKILYFLPLEDSEEQRLLHRFTSVAGATIKSTLIIGMIQGLICGIGFALADIQGPVFWGTVMAVMSIIPAFGTAIIWGPALAILALTGDFRGVIILAVVCGGIAGNLDNLLRPRLVGKDTEMHDLFVLFGTLGGIAMFGLLGIIIGPIVSALFITIWEIYGDSFREYLPAVHLFGEENREQETAAQAPPPDRERDAD